MRHKLLAVLSLALIFSIVTPLAYDTVGTRVVIAEAKVKRKAHKKDKTKKKDWKTATVKASLVSTSIVNRGIDSTDHKGLYLIGVRYAGRYEVKADLNFDISVVGEDDNERAVDRSVTKSVYVKPGVVTYILVKGTKEKRSVADARIDARADKYSCTKATIHTKKNSRGEVVPAYNICKLGTFNNLTSAKDRLSFNKDCTTMTIKYDCDFVAQSNGSSNVDVRPIYFYGSSIIGVGSAKQIHTGSFSAGDDMGTASGSMTFNAKDVLQSKSDKAHFTNTGNVLVVPVAATVGF